MDMKKTWLTLSAVVLAGAISAQNPPAEQQPAQPASDQPMPVVRGTAADPRDTNVPASAAGTLEESDRTFITRAGFSGLFEIQSSQLATTASQNQAVVTFARQMVNDHTAANSRLMQLAAQKRVSVPQNLDAKHSEKLSKLAGKQGEEFDKTYGKMQVKAHEEAVNLFQQTAQNAQDPDVKQFAADTLPKLQQHLEQARQLPGADKANEKKDDTAHRVQNQNPDQPRTLPANN